MGFCAVMPLVGKKGRWRLSRTVVLPDFQGMGIGAKLSEAVASLYVERACRVNATASHPALIAHRSRSPLWKTVAVNRYGVRPSGIRAEGDPNTVRRTATLGRGIVSFEDMGSE